MAKNFMNSFPFFGYINVFVFVLTIILYGFYFKISNVTKMEQFEFNGIEPQPLNESRKIFKKAQGTI